MASVISKEFYFNISENTSEIKQTEVTPEEIAQAEAQQLEAEKQYWQSVDYGEAINFEIRKKYTQSQEFAILRQKEEKPDEYAEYFAYCESCKAYVKEQKAKCESEGDQSGQADTEINESEGDTDG